jgi:hypothetical protein
MTDKNGNPVSNLTSYEMRHLVAHLAAAGRERDLHSLLSMETGRERNAWHAAKYETGDVSGYLFDVQTAWRLAYESGSCADEDHCETPCIETRYALASSSINSLAEAVPSNLIVAAVQHQIWRFEQGLTYARRIPDLKQRSITLALLKPLAPEEEKQDIFDDAISAALKIDFHFDRAKVLMQLFRTSPERLKHIIVRELLHLADIVDEKDLQEVFHVTPADQKTLLIGEALLFAREQGDNVRVKLLRIFDGEIPEDLYIEALAAVFGIEDEWAKRDALEDLAPHIPSNLLEKVLPVGYEACKWIDTGWVIGLAPFVSEETLAKTLRVVAELANNPDTNDRAFDTLIGLVRHFSDRLLREAFSIAETQLETPDGLRWLMVLEAYLPQELHEKAVSKIRSAGLDRFVSASSKAKESIRASMATSDLSTDRKETESDNEAAEFLSEADGGSRLDRISEIENQYDRAKAFKDVITILPQALIPKALDMAGTAERYQKLGLLALLAPRLDAAAREAALREVPKLISTGSVSKEHVNSLAPYLPKSVIKKTVDALRAIADAYDRVMFQITLLPDILPDDKKHSIEYLMTHIRRLQDQNVMVKASSALFPYLSESQAHEIIDYILQKRNIDKDRLDNTLAEFASMSAGMDTSVRTKLFQLACTIRNKKLRQRAIEALIPILPEPVRAKAIGNLLALGPRIIVSRTLTELKRFFSEEVFEELLELAFQTNNERVRSARLTALVEVLPDRLIKPALERAYSIQAAEYRANALSAILNHLPQDRKQLVSSEIMRILQNEENIGGKDRLFEKIAPHLTAEQLSEAMDMLAHMSQRTRIDALWKLVPYLNETLAESALALAREIDIDDYIRVVFMLDLIPRLPRQLREGVLTETTSATLRVTDPLVFEAHLEDLLQVASKLPEKSLRDLASKASELQINKETIFKTLLEHAAHLPEHARADARRAALKEIDNIENLYTRFKLLERSTILSPSDKAEMIKAALNFVLTENNNEKQNYELVEIIKEILGLPRKDMMPLLHNALIVLSKERRSEVLQSLRAFVPIMIRIGGPDSATKIFHAVEDASRWWP